MKVFGDTIEKDLQCLSSFGRLLLFGGRLGGEETRISPDILHSANKALIGFSFGHYRRFRPEIVAKTMTKVINLLENNQIEILLSKSFPLKEASQAHRYIEERRSLGKVILVVNNL